MWTTLSLLVGCIIQVFGNRPPVFVDPQFILPSESVPIGDVLYTLSAHDLDDQNLQFSIDPSDTETHDLVKLGTPTVTVQGSGCIAQVPVILIKHLDRDYEPTDRTLTIRISDGTNRVSGRTSVTIRDVNDVKPSFRNLPYRAKVREDAEPGTIIFQNMTIVDPDTVFWGYKYSIKAFQSKFQDLFSIHPTNGIVRLNGTLDYEQNTFYQLTITVRDQHLESQTELIVTVIDVQDTPPSFLNQPYTKTIREDIAVGDSVLTVSALDGDHGVPNDIKYYFKPPDANFDIDNTTGVITVANTLESDVPEIRNRANVFDLTVVAEEVNSMFPTGTNITVTTHVTVTVSDVNDNGPTFNRDRYKATVVENMMEGIPITLEEGIVVGDIDQGDNSKFSVSLWKDGQPFTVFKPTPDLVWSKSPLLILIQNSSFLDYEALSQSGGNPIVFEIVAQETETAEKYNSTATITVTVIDSNDNYPIFSDTSYVARVDENSPPATPVIKVSATDKDSANFGDVTYRFRGTTQKFSIHPKSGQVYVAGHLDRESVSVYYLTIEARDGGNIGTSVQLTVFVDDKNDETPKFRRGKYDGYIRENSTVFLRPVIVKADDLDKKGTNNSVIRYRFKSLPPGLTTNFTIDPVSGEIHVVGSLDYEKLPGGEATLTLVVEAYDLGDPQLSSTENVTVTVEDINDNAPEFVQSMYHVTIKENAVPGSHVQTVAATDKDGQTPNNEVIYRIQAGALDKFRIDANSGEITVERGATFDRDLQPNYDVIVVASDKGTPPLSSDCTVNITLTDVNNKDPVFVRISGPALVYENASVGEVVVRAMATDPDHNPDLVYGMVVNRTLGYDGGMKQLKDDTFLQDYFTIDNKTGDIKVKSTLNREHVDFVSVVVTVEDMNAIAGRQITTGTVTITILDLNDNPPVFTENIYYANVSEGVLKDVITVRATDVDKVSAITYTIPNNSPFVMNKNTGTLSIATKLDRETTPSYNITVTANDHGWPNPLSSTALITINVLDANDNPPIFKDRNLIAYVQENETLGALVTSVSTKDKDIGEFAKVAYSIQSGNVNNTFTINQNGEIRLANKLDRETKLEYTLRIEAKDNPTGRPDSQNVKYTDVSIFVDDVNDNVPTFTESDYRVEEPILENAAINMNVFKVTASDDDIGLNQQLRYDLVRDQTNATDLFKINHGSGQIKVAKSLEGKFGTFYLTVRVTDTGVNPLSSTCKVWVDIKDVNTHSPIFVVPSTAELKVRMPEDSNTTDGIVERKIYTVLATDADRGDNGRVWYRFANTSRDEHRSFRIDAVTGDIFLKVKLDYETKQIYEATIIASDHGTPPSIPARLPFILQVYDTDDHAPVFTKEDPTEPYVLSTREEQTPPAKVGQIALATDEDTGNYSKICYCFKGSYPAFSLDKETGDLYLVRRLDRESMATPFISLVIQARQSCHCETATRTKRSTPERRKRSTDQPIPPEYDSNDASLLWVVVNIIDTNDNPPVLKDNTSTLSVGITRDTQKNSVIFDLRKSITDLDEASENSYHTFTLNKTSMSDALRAKFTENDYTNAPFKLESNGRLRTAMYFQNDMSGYFILTFVASDQGGSLMGDIYVSLVNDDQRVRIIIRGTPDEVGNNKDIIAKKLSEVTGFTIVIDKIQTHEDVTGSEQSLKTDMFIHAEDPVTKEVISAELLTRKIDDNIQLLSQFYKEVNILEVVPSKPVKEEDTSEETYKMALILVSVILCIVLIVVIALFISTHRKDKRRLKASSNIFGNNHAYLDSQLKLDLPGTNLHATEASNPVWLEEYDNAAMQIDSDRDDNSLDENVIENRTGAELYDEQEINIDLFSDDQYPPPPPQSHLSNLHAHDLASQQNNNLSHSPNGTPGKYRNSQIGNGYTNQYPDVNNIDVNKLETTEI